MAEDEESPRQRSVTAAPRLSLRRSTIADALLDRGQRQRLELPEDESEPGPIVVELNLTHEHALSGAADRFLALYERFVPNAAERQPDPIGNTYYRCLLSVDEVRRLVAEDSRAPSERNRAIYRVWPDFPVRALIDRSVATVKADAARRSYEANGDGITWAVIDSGIDAQHPHFTTYDSLGGDAENLHKDFGGGSKPLEDRFGHGSHVAGIIAGGLPVTKNVKAFVGQRVADDVHGGEKVIERAGIDPARLSGVAPRCKLVSLKALDDHGDSRSTNIIAALQHVREEINGNGKYLRVHGVNLSLGYEFDARWFACGQSPICVEVDKLVRSGVVVVVAAGNTGYGDLTSNEGLTGAGLTLTINDPGNSALAITVGATHRDSPHTYGVSYFSSKGPTGDGRLKPDVVAPGERITSCATGDKLALLKDAWKRPPGPGAATYLDESGTSMAAPHVSGAIAAFLSIRREFIGRPEEVKRIFLETATSLGRERYFEGAGLVDLMRAIQSV